MLTLKDIINLLNINQNNFNEVTDDFIEKFLSLRKSGQREVYRIPLSDKESVAITVSDPMEVLDSKISDIIILDINLKYQIENHSKTSFGTQEIPFDFDALKKVESGEELLAKIKGLKNLGSQDILNFRTPYTLKGFVIKSEVPILSVSAAVSNTPTTTMQKFLTETAKGNEEVVEGIPDKIFSINVNIGISNVRSKFMR